MFFTFFLLVWISSIEPSKTIQRLSVDQRFQWANSDKQKKHQKHYFFHSICTAVKNISVSTTTNRTSVSGFGFRNSDNQKIFRCGFKHKHFWLIKLVLATPVDRKTIAMLTSRREARQTFELCVQSCVWCNKTIIRRWLCDLVVIIKSGTPILISFKWQQETLQPEPAREEIALLQTTKQKITTRRLQCTACAIFIKTVAISCATEQICCHTNSETNGKAWVCSCCMKSAMASFLPTRPQITIGRPRRQGESHCRLPTAQ